MAFHRKWYVISFLSVILILAIAALLVYLDRRETGEVIFSTTLPVATGQSQNVTIDLTASDQQHTLVLAPDIENGWGEPDVYLEARLLDPQGKTILRIDEDVLFGSPGGDYSHNYHEKFNFIVNKSGLYELSIKCLTAHVEDISIQVGRGGIVMSNILGLAIVALIILGLGAAALLIK